MPKFVVMLEETVRYYIEVEASDADDAQANAEDIFVQSEDPFGDFEGECHSRWAAAVTPAEAA